MIRKPYGSSRFILEDHDLINGFTMAYSRIRTVAFQCPNRESELEALSPPRLVFFVRGLQHVGTSYARSYIQGHKHLIHIGRA